MDTIKCNHRGCRAAEKTYDSRQDLLRHGIDEHSTSIIWYCATCSKELSIKSRHKVDGMPIDSSWKRHENNSTHQENMGLIPKQGTKRKRKTKTSSNNEADSTQIDLNENDSTESMMLEGEDLDATVQVEETVTATNDTTPLVIDYTAQIATNPSQFNAQTQDFNLEPEQCSEIEQEDSEVHDLDATTIQINVEKNPQDWLGLEDLEAAVNQKMPDEDHKFIVPDFSFDNTDPDYFPFPNATTSFFASLLLLFPDSSTLINMVLEFLSKPRHGFNVNEVPLSTESLVKWMPFLEKDVVKNPDFGFPLKMCITKNAGLCCYFPVKTIFQTVMADPTLAKHITDKVPIKLEDGSVREIVNAPIYSKSTMTTKLLSFKYVEISKNNQINIEDFVRFTQTVDGNTITAYGLVKALYLKESDLNFNRVCVDIQKIIPFSNITQPTTADNPAELILTSEVITLNASELIVDNSVLCKRESMCTAFRTLFVPFLRSQWNWQPPTGLDQSSQDKIKKKLRVIIVEANKDELTMFRTRGSLSDVGNFIIKDGPIWLQEKFNSIWTAMAFSSEVPPEERFKILVRLIIEGERGFWLFNACTKDWEYCVVCFALYTSDQKECVALCSATQHTGTAISQCHRCLARKKDLDNFNYPRKALAMTSSRRMLIYKQANRVGAAEGKKLLREYGLTTKVCAASFCHSLRVPEHAVADLLHNFGINSGTWLLTLLYVFQNKTGRQAVTSELKNRGKQLKNRLISSLFQDKNGKPIEAELSTISSVKKTNKLKGTDYVQLMEYMDSILLVVNKEQNYGTEFNHLFTQLPGEAWNTIEQRLNTQIQKSMGAMIGYLMKYFIKSYYILKERRNTNIWNAKRERILSTFFIILMTLFPGLLLKPTFHDSMHMVDQIKAVLPLLIANCGKTEALNKDHRLAALIGNNRNAEFFILLRQWAVRLTQFMINGGWFIEHDSTLGRKETKVTGKKLQEMLCDLFHQNDKSRLTFPTPLQVLQPDWFTSTKRNPTICADDVFVQNIINDGLHQRKDRTGLKNLVDSADITCFDPSCFWNSHSDNYIQAKTALVPDKGKVSLSAIIELEVKGFNISSVGTGSIYRSVDKTQCVMFSLESVLCCPKTFGEFSQNTRREIKTKEKGINSMKQELNGIKKKIGELQLQAAEVDTEVNKITKEIDVLISKEQHQWLPSVLLQGRLVSLVKHRDLDSRFHYTAGKIVQMSSETIICKASQILNHYSIVESFSTQPSAPLIPQEYLILNKYY